MTEQSTTPTEDWLVLLQHYGWENILTEPDGDTSDAAHEDSPLPPPPERRS